VIESNEQTTTPRKRRSREEVRADLQARLKDIEAQEKAEVVRELAHAHDAVSALVENKAIPQIKAALVEIVGKLKAVLGTAEKA